MPRRKRHADHPKRAMTAYMLFCQEKRTEIKDKNPDVGFGQVGKLLGEAWKELPTGDKAKYNEIAAKDKIRYQKDMAAYKAEHPESSSDEEDKKKKPAKKKRKKDPNAPKKPASAYFHFSKKMRPKIKEDNPAATFGELGKLLGAAWKGLPADEKKPYETAAEEDKQRYEKENKAYQSKKKAASSSDSSSSDDDSDESSSSSDSESD